MNASTQQEAGSLDIRGEGVVLRDLAVALGGRTIIPGLDLEVERGELVSMLGPSGCGKTTTLRMIGGFQQPDRGKILIGGRDWAGKPPEARPTAMVFQSYALWPHMSVAKNVAYPLVTRRVPKAEQQQRVTTVLEMVGLHQKAARRPARLSGGEQQRVALARALVQEPDVLLLDEPLSNLDAKLRVQVREEIRRIQRDVGITSVFVTHDQEEALAVSDRVAVMNEGRIEQLSDPVTLYQRPATEFVAGFIGQMTMLDARVENGVTGTEIVTEQGVRVRVERVDATQRNLVRIGVRPEQVRLGQPLDATVIDGDTAARQGLARIEQITPRGHQAEVRLRLRDLELTALALVGSVEPGQHVPISVDEALVYVDGHLKAPS